jgi:hypothetical protein
MSENAADPNDQAHAVGFPDAGGPPIAGPNEDQALAIDVCLLCNISS